MAGHLPCASDDRRSRIPTWPDDRCARRGMDGAAGVIRRAAIADLWH
jgi:hypothetical protein